MKSLNKLRSKSEEVFLKSLKDLEDKYESTINKILTNEEEKFQNWEECCEKSIQSVEFEKEAFLALVDVLYNSKGKMIYSEITPMSIEFGHLATLVNKSSNQDQTWTLNKAFHINFSDIEYSESNLWPRLFAKLSIKEAKEFLENRNLPELSESIADDKFGGSIELGNTNHLILTLRWNKKASTKENAVLVNWKNGDFDRIIPEFGLIISWRSAADQATYLMLKEDERIVEVISNWYNLPTESIAMIK